MEIKFNLNDEVTFRIKPESLSLFDGNPVIKIETILTDGSWRARTQLHYLIVFLAPHIGHGLDCPIYTEISIKSP